MKKAIYRKEKNFILKNLSMDEAKKEIKNDEGYIILKSLNSKFKILKGKLLDAGCGTGRWLYGLYNKNIEIYGLDINIKLLKLINYNIPTILGDIRKMPFKNETFDTIISYGVFEHLIEGPHIPLTEAYKCIKKGGYLVFTVPFLSINRLLNPYVFIRSILSRSNFFRKLFHKGEKNFFCYEFSIGGIKSCVQNSGFSIIFYTPIYVDFGLRDDFRIFYPLVSKLSIINSKLIKYIFGSFLLFVCKK